MWVIMNKYIIEFIGTFFLTLTVALTGNPLAIGAVLIAMIYMGGYISGAHYNPAVTIAVLVRGKIEKIEAKKYIISQVLGALTASAAYMILKQSMFVPSASGDALTLHVVLMEFLFTFALCSVVLHVATSDKSKNNQYFGLAIGLTVMAGAFAGGTISGGVYNPAIATGSMLLDFANISTHLQPWLIYVLSQFAAAISAGLVFRKVVLEK